MTLAGSQVVERARPWHSGQAPKAELKEKLRGSSLGTSRPPVGAGHGGGEQLLLAASDRDQREAVGQLERFGNGSIEALFRPKACLVAMAVRRVRGA